MKKQFFLSFVVLLGGFMLASCSSSFSIVGKWTIVEGPKTNELASMEFKRDGTVTKVPRSKAGSDASFEQSYEFQRDTDREEKRLGYLQISLNDSQLLAEQIVYETTKKNQIRIELSNGDFFILERE